MSTITRIDYKIMYEAKDLYGMQRALDDLLLTIPYCLEKTYLYSSVQADKEQIQSKISDWWKKAAQITGKTFSDTAIIYFDNCTITD